MVQRYPAHQNGAFVVQNGALVPQAALDTGVQAGGDGTGVGSPSFESNINSTLYAVDDLGMDPDGNEAINSKFKNAVSDNTEIIFEPGTYRYDPTNNGKGMVFLGLQNFAVKGNGSTRDDVRIKHTDGTSGRLWNFGGSCHNIWWANFVIDESPSGNYTELNYTSDGYLYAYNIAHRGGAADELNNGSPGDPYGNGSQISFSMDSTGKVDLINYESIDPPERLVDYPHNTQCLFAGYGNQGPINLTNARIEYKGEHAAYMSRSRGEVHVDGGRFVNNANTNMRIAGQGTYIHDATIGLTRSNASLQQENGDTKSIRGLRVEANKEELGGKTYGEAKNVDFVKTETYDNSSMLIEINGTHGRFDLRNCRLLDDSQDAMPIIDVEAIGSDGSVTPPEPHDCLFENCSFTGDGTAPAVDSNRSSAPVKIQDCCIDMPNSSGFQGYYNESGTTYSACDVAEL